MIRHAVVASALTLAIGASPAPGQVRQEIPSHPKQLTFEPIVFEQLPPAKDKLVELGEIRLQPLDAPDPL